MDWYLSTYRKDFVWPYVTTFPIHALSETHSKKVLTRKSAGSGRVRCTCGLETGGLTAPIKENPGPPVAEAHKWNRFESTAPLLLDQKCHPEKMGPAPEFEITPYDQANMDTYGKKLQEKYPHLYNVLKSAPSDDITRRYIDQDRLRTTYQVDYGHVDEYRDYDKLLAKAGNHSERINETVPYNTRPPDYSDTTTNRPGRFEDLREGVGHATGELGEVFREDTNYRDGFRYNARGFQDSREAATNYIEPLEHDSGKAPREFDHSREVETKNSAFKDESAKSGRNAHENHQEAAHRGESGGRDAIIINSGDGVTEAFVRSTEKKEEGKASALPTWRTEYQEVIGQTGYDIIRDKIHRHGVRSRGRSFVDRIIMKCRRL